MIELARRTWRILWRAVQAFIEDQALTHGAALAFYTGLSMAPILVLLVMITSGLGKETQEHLIDEIARLVGRQGADVVDLILTNADRDVDTENLAGWLSLGALLVSATAVFAQLQVALNTIWAVKPKVQGLGIVSWLRKRLLSLGLILSFGFLLLVSLVVSSVLSSIIYRMQDSWPAAGVLWPVTDFVLPLIIYVVMFGALFRYIPDADLRWRHVLFGGVVTAFLFVLGKWLIGLYLANSTVGTAYGAAGSLILLLLWAFYSSAIVLFGAELTQAWVREHGERIRLEPHAERGRGDERSSRATETGTVQQEPKREPAAGSTARNPQEPREDRDGPSEGT